jgi:hypothetical protein
MLVLRRGRSRHSPPGDLGWRRLPLPYGRAYALDRLNVHAMGRFRRRRDDSDAFGKTSKGFDSVD